MRFLQTLTNVRNSPSLNRLQCVFIFIWKYSPFQQWAHRRGTQWQVNIAWMVNVRRTAARKTLLYWGTVNSHTEEPTILKAPQQLIGRMYKQHDLSCRGQTVVTESCKHFFAHRGSGTTVRRTELKPSAPLCSGLWAHVTHMVTCRGYYFLSLSAVKDTEAQHYHNLSCRTESYCGWAEGSGQTIPEKIIMLNVQCNWWMDNVVISFILFVESHKPRGNFQSIASDKPVMHDFIMTTGLDQFEFERWQPLFGSAYR